MREVSHSPSQPESLNTPTTQERLATLGLSAETDTEQQRRQRLEGYFGGEAINAVESLSELLHSDEQSRTLAEKVNDINTIYTVVSEMEREEADTRRTLGKRKNVHVALSGYAGKEITPADATAVLFAYAVNQLPSGQLSHDDIDRTVQAQARRLAMGKNPNTHDGHANLALRHIQNSARSSTENEITRISQQLIKDTAEGSLQWSHIQAVGAEVNERRHQYEETGEASLISLQEAPLIDEPFIAIDRNVLHDDLSKTVGGHPGGEIKNAESLPNNAHRVAWLFAMADKWRESQNIDPEDDTLKPSYYRSQFNSGDSAYVAVELKERSPEGEIITSVFTVSTRSGSRDAAYVVRSDQIPEDMTWQEALAGTKTDARDRGAVKVSNQTTTRSTAVDRAYELLRNPELYQKRRQESVRRIGNVALQSS